MEFTLLFAAMFAVAAAWLALRWEAARGNAADCAADLWDVFLVAALTGLFVGRLAAMIAAGVNPIASPGDIIIIRGGVATGWASLAALATVAVVARHELVLVADALAVAALAALGGWHTGCLAREACLGTPSNLPWAFSQPESAVSRHPVELYAAALYIVAAVILARRRRHPMAPGQAASWALLVASVGRLITEPLRPSLGAGPVLWYWAGAFVGLAGIAWARRRGAR